MARYDHLPIYRACFDLCLYFEQTVRGMARYDKYTLGAYLRNLCREVLKLIIRANSLEDRFAELYEIRARLEELKVVLRLARQSKAIQRAKSYEFAAKKISEISRQNEGWLASQLKREGRNSGRLIPDGSEPTEQHVM